MFICKTAKFVPVWTTILKIRVIFVHQTLTEHALYVMCNSCQQIIDIISLKILLAIKCD